MLKFQYRLLFLCCFLVKVSQAIDPYNEAIRSFSDVVINLMISQLSRYVHENDRRGISEIIIFPTRFVDQFKDDLFDLHSEESVWRRQMFITKKAGIARFLKNATEPEQIFAGLVEFSFRDPEDLATKVWVKYDMWVTMDTEKDFKITNFHRIKRSKPRI